MIKLIRVSSCGWEINHDRRRKGKSIAVVPGNNRKVCEWSHVTWRYVCERAANECCIASNSKKKAVIIENIERNITGRRNRKRTGEHVLEIQHRTNGSFETITLRGHGSCKIPVLINHNICE